MGAEKKEEEKKEDEKNEEGEEDKKEDEKNEEKEEEKEEDEDDEKNEEEEESEDEDEKEDDKGLRKFEEEVLLLYKNDLKIGFFNYKIINAGEKFVIYEEINKEFSVLDFCLNIEDLDVKLTITDLTEGREIYNKERLNSFFETPLKMIMFFTSQRILKFEFDNSYSWITSKTIKYKINTFYPKNPYLISHQILLSKYKKAILRTKNLAKKKAKKK